VPASESLSLGLEFYTYDSGVYKYSTAIYYSVMMYLVNETNPTVLYERQFVQLIALISAIFNANIFGNITVLVQQLN